MVQDATLTNGRHFVSRRCLPPRFGRIWPKIGGISEMEDFVQFDPHARLRDLGMRLPDVSPPKGSYMSATRAGNLVYVSGQVPMTHGEVTVTGKVGAGISLERARELSEQCMLAALAAIDATVGLSTVVRVVKVVGYVVSADGFTDQPSVIDGASSLLVDIFGDAGRHARSSVGVAALPLGAPVEIEVIVEVEAAA